ncbi:DNA polymerase alpha subunit B-like [Amphiura filiformis]|uniref:DNA polymerase alpha subunit B-like n=1 Tax=Amphiura filiformis TaxID=82378 RepID=UPI003B21687F
MTEISEEDLISEFEVFDIDLTNAEVIDKLKELCLVFRLDCTDLASEWVAFSHTNDNLNLTLDTLDRLERDTGKRCKLYVYRPGGGELCLVFCLDCTDLASEWVALSHTNDNLNLTLDTLDRLERDRLSKKKTIAKTPISSKPQSRFGSGISNRTSLGSEADDDLLSSYGTPARKGTQKRPHTTPENVSNKRGILPKNVTAAFSPGSLGSPAATPSQKYSSRSNAKEIVARYGAVGNVVWTGAENAASCQIDTLNPQSTLKNNYKYMFQKLTEKALVLNDMIEDMTEVLQEKYNIESISHVAFPVQEPVTIVGRVCCDSNGRLNAQSVLLEGSVETSSGKQVAIHLGNVHEFSLFPGQIVAMDGTNTSGSKFVASKVYEGVPLPLPDIENSLLDYGALQVLTAAGPFTTSDNLNFDALNDLIKVVQQDKPDVCILFGPFVDAKHTHIEELDSTYDELFTKLVQEMMDATERFGTQVVLVPSLRDVHHCYVYPQPPFNCKLNEPSERLHFVSDPCTISVNGIVFGLTSTDILFHLGAEEISHPPGGSDRLGRLVKHMVAQQNYYPLCPSHVSVPIDYEQFANYAHMTVTPDILITPSDLRYFIKDVLGCMSINPGRLTKGQGGGTYGRLVIQPSKTDNGSRGKGVLDRTTAKIVRI